MKAKGGGIFFQSRWNGGGILRGGESGGGLRLQPCFQVQILPEPWSLRGHLEPGLVPDLKGGGEKDEPLLWLREVVAGLETHCPNQAALPPATHP